MIDKNSAAFLESAAPLEEALRHSAPLLSPALKSRTLANCATRAAALRARQQRLNRQLSWAVIAVLAMQSLTVWFVDAQNTQLIAGNSPAPAFASLSFGQVTELLRERSRQLAQLMEPSRVG